MFYAYHNSHAVDVTAGTGGCSRCIGHTWCVGLTDVDKRHGYAEDMTGHLDEFSVESLAHLHTAVTDEHRTISNDMNERTTLLALHLRCIYVRLFCISQSSLIILKLNSFQIKFEWNWLKSNFLSIKTKACTLFSIKSNTWLRKIAPKLIPNLVGITAMPRFFHLFSLLTHTHITMKLAYVITNNVPRTWSYLWFSFHHISLRCNHDVMMQLVNYNCSCNKRIWIYD